MCIYDLDLLESNCRRMFFDFFMKEAFKWIDNEIYYNQMNIFEKRMFEAKVKYNDDMFEAFIFERISFREINIRGRYIDVKLR